MAIRGVVFDLFHTLVDTEHLRPPGYHVTHPIAELLGLDLEPLRRWWHTTSDERETTPVDLVDLVQRYLGPSGRTLTPVERTRIDGYLGVARDDVLRHPEPEMVALVGRLVADARVGVLSNCYEREVRCWPESPFAPLVHGFVRSCDIGVMKPAADAYRAALDPLGIPASEAVYVGNGASDELAGAARFGFAGVIHCNVFDRSNGLVDEPEQRRRAAQSDVSVDTIVALEGALGTWL
ncbi:MAG: HAD family hydrolase [Ilumatobacter sp.]|uniref:HAD family hydrolase n=1 Tax=Ilumatobacter sp. TaxID=1967498 RepID=UPI00261206FC|nr:HAD family hydrolase [Ilumatobacter sp.]MDJ0771406.1 HAD family hydrolase [Ilumatobacter sp.]